MRDPSTFVEIMKMFETLIIEVITKYDSLCLPHLGFFGMLQSVYGCDKKTQLTRDRNSCLEVFCKKCFLKVLQNVQKTIPLVPEFLFKKFAGLQITALLKPFNTSINLLTPPAQVFLCEFLKAPIFVEYLRTTASL